MVFTYNFTYVTECWESKNFFCCLDFMFNRNLIVKVGKSTRV